MPETSNHDYNIPEQGQSDWHIPINENIRQHDTDVEIRDIEANRSDYEPKDGAKFFSTDTGRVYLGDGSSWTELASTGENPAVSGTIHTQRSMPTTSTLGEGEVMVYNSDGSDGHTAGDLVYAINDGEIIQTQVIAGSSSQSNIIFSDNFDDGVYDDTWNVTPEHSVESVTEEGGVFTYNSPIDETIYESDMTVITDQVISGTGTHIIEAEFRIESYRRIRVFRLLDEDSENTISLNEEKQNGSFVLSLPNNQVDLGTDLGDGSYRTYQLEIDFDSNQIVSVTRGDESYSINESFGSGFETYKLGIGEGNGRSQFRSISIRQT